MPFPRFWDGLVNVPLLTDAAALGGAQLVLVGHELGDALVDVLVVHGGSSWSVVVVGRCGGSAGPPGQSPVGSAGPVRWVSKKRRIRCQASSADG